MAINFDDAFEVNENGIALTDDQGNVAFYITSGDGVPLDPAPANSMYLDKQSQILYFNPSQGSNWRQFRASDVYALDSDGLPSTAQAVLDTITSGGTPAVSQTLIFGDGGNSAQNSYLPNQGVQSNVVGITVGLANAQIRSVFLGNENIRTGNVEIQQRSPAGTGTYTTVYTLVLNNQNFANITGLSVPVIQNAEIAVITRVSLKNCKVVVNINGDSA